MDNSLFLQTDSSLSEESVKNNDINNDFSDEEIPLETNIQKEIVNHNDNHIVSKTTNNNIIPSSVIPKPMTRNAISSNDAINDTFNNITNENHKEHILPETIEIIKPIFNLKNINNVNNVYELLRDTLNYFCKIREDRIIQRDTQINNIINLSDNEQQLISKIIKEDNDFFSNTFIIINKAYQEICLLREKYSENKLETKNITNDPENGWDLEANQTIKKWYNLFRESSFIYQWIYDRNIKRANILSIVSAVISAFLSLISGIKLWQNGNLTFGFITDILLMVINLIIAVLIGISKTILDDKKNEEIRNYIMEIDTFSGEIAAQCLKTPNYRTNADEFFSKNNDKYIKLVASAPNLSLGDFSRAKRVFERHKLIEIQEKDKENINIKIENY